MSDWLIENFLPIGHRGMDTAPEGNFKTICGCCLAVCIASRAHFLERIVKQGPVLIVDEETPENSLMSHLNRFAIGMGVNYEKLPIYVQSMSGFRFGRDVPIKNLLKLVDKIKPAFIRLDSLIAMLPSGRQALSENDCHLGEIVRDNLNQLLAASPDCSIMLAAHAKKPIADLSLPELSEKQMQSVVRGHGSIVGEGCDTGFIIKKMSEHPDPSRFAIIIKSRRQAIPGDKVIYVELQEESYGAGWAKLVSIPWSSLPPSKYASDLYQFFADKHPHSSKEITREFAFFTRQQCYDGVKELLDRKVILPGTKPQTYKLNPKRGKDCDLKYMEILGKT